MANKIDIYEGNYSLTVKRTVSKFGTSIVDKDGNKILALIPSHDGDGLILGCPNIAGRDAPVWTRMIKELPEEDMLQVFKIGRKAAVELDKSFVASKHVSDKIDILNFIDVSNGRFSAMTHDETKMIGGSNINVKARHDYYTRDIEGDSGKLIASRFTYKPERYVGKNKNSYAVIDIPDSKMSIDINGAINTPIHQTWKNHALTLKKEDADFSNVEIVDSVGVLYEYEDRLRKDSHNNIEKQSIILSYNQDNMDNFKFPKISTENVLFVIAPEQENFFDFLSIPPYETIKDGIEKGMNIMLNMNRIIPYAKNIETCYRRKDAGLTFTYNEIKKEIKEHPKKAKQFSDGLDTLDKILKNNPEFISSNIGKENMKEFCHKLPVLHQFRDDIVEYANHVKKNDISISNS